MGAHRRPRGRVLVVDDDPLVRELVATTLGEHGYATWQLAKGAEVVRFTRAHRPNVVVLDVRLPDLTGYQVCRDLREQFGDGIGILFISGERTESLDRVGGLLLGADDYLAKPFLLDELLVRVSRLLRRHWPAPRALGYRLTPRELEVLQLMACGMDHLEIAESLVVSAKTVEKHIEHILGKLGVHSRAQAIAVAFRDELDRGSPSPDAADESLEGLGPRRSLRDVSSSSA